jgi:hypothetical protein
MEGHEMTKRITENIKVIINASGKDCQVYGDLSRVNTRTNSSIIIPKEIAVRIEIRGLLSFVNIDRIAERERRNSP